uniref:Uncharacterized protein n=1 Tax=Amphimedon queenslandica TaxID=400682 RepID=A0A1X7VPN3_AMPQE
MGAVELEAGPTPFALPIPLTLTVPPGLTTGTIGGQRTAPTVTIPLATALDVRVANAPIDESGEPGNTPKMQPGLGPPGRELPALELLTDPNTPAPKPGLDTDPTIAVGTGIGVPATIVTAIEVLGIVLGVEEDAIIDRTQHIQETKSCSKGYSTLEFSNVLWLQLTYILAD